MARREQIMRRHKQILKSSSVFSLIVQYSSHLYPLLSHPPFPLRGWLQTETGRSLNKPWKCLDEIRFGTAQLSKLMWNFSLCRNTVVNQLASCKYTPTSKCCLFVACGYFGTAKCCFVLMQRSVFLLFFTSFIWSREQTCHFSPPGDYWPLCWGESVHHLGIHACTVSQMFHKIAACFSKPVVFQGCDNTG